MLYYVKMNLSYKIDSYKLQVPQLQIPHVHLDNLKELMDHVLHVVLML